jgi:hypothetical protein
MAMNGQERTKRTNEKGKEDSAAMRLMRLYLDHEDYGNACFFIVLPEFCFPCCSAVAGVHVSSLYLDISLCSRPGHVLFLVILSDHFLDLGFWISDFFGKTSKAFVIRTYPIPLLAAIADRDTVISSFCFRPLDESKRVESDRILLRANSTQAYLGYLGILDYLGDFSASSWARDMYARRSLL